MFQFCKSSGFYSELIQPTEYRNQHNIPHLSHSPLPPNTEKHTRPFPCKTPTGCSSSSCEQPGPRPRERSVCRFTRGTGVEQARVGRRAERPHSVFWAEMSTRGVVISSKKPHDKLSPFKNYNRKTGRDCASFSWENEASERGGQ